MMAKIGLVSGHGFSRAEIAPLRIGRELLHVQEFAPGLCCHGFGTTEVGP